jgi:spore coat polysaccharide biosynthesis predicted glycosyltransferase SpsG
MTACADLRVLFRAPAGPRRGFGHLVRCRSFARALGVRPLIALRGRAVAVDAALRLGCDVVSGPPSRLLGSLQPDVLIVDDPIAADARRWIAEARKTGCLVVSVHDLGLGCLDADLIIDGSVAPTRAADAGSHALTGADFAVLDPAIARQRRRIQPEPERVLIALGGGPHAELAREIAEAIVTAHPEARIRIAAGFAKQRAAAAGVPLSGGRIAWLDTPSGLAEELARSSVAVVGGGVSLYEACALGVPAVGVPVVPAQRPTVHAFVTRGAACGVARGRGVPEPQRVAEQAVQLLVDGALRRRIGGTARRLVDGQGARRAAAAVMDAVINRARRAG